MNIKDLVIQLAVAKAIADQAKLVQDTVKAELQKQMDPGDRKQARLDGADIGTISYAKSAPEAVVTDEAAFLQWVRATKPDAIRFPVTVDAHDLLKVDVDKDALRRVVEHATARIMRAPVIDSFWQADVLSGCLKAKAAVYVPTGEEIPGVTYRPGGEGKYVSARISDAQYAELVQAYQEGKIDLLALGTVAPELEA
jgi:hypothetical protein